LSEQSECICSIGQLYAGLLSSDSGIDETKNRFRKRENFELFSFDKDSKDFVEPVLPVLQEWTERKPHIQSYKTRLNISRRCSTHF